jgi:hypothetical protein
VVFSASPTLSGTIGGALSWSGTQSFADGTFSGTLGVTGLTTAMGGLTLGAAFTDKVTAVSSNTTTTTAHSTFIGDATSGSFTLTLISAVAHSGLTYTIFKSDASTNTITVDGNGSETIGGALTVVLAGNTANSVLVIVSDGANWRIKEWYEEGTFTASLTGISGSSTATIFWNRSRKIVTFTLPNITGTSNTTACTITGFPTAIAPVTQQILQPGIYNIVNNSSGSLVTTGQYARIETSGVITLLFGSSTTGFTVSGTKGIQSPLGSETRLLYTIND